MGGLITSLSEMTFGSNYGVKVEKPKKLGNLNQYFLEKIKEDIFWKSIQKILKK